jgi:hypothetical protein
VFLPWLRRPRGDAPGARRGRRCRCRPRCRRSANRRRCRGWPAGSAVMRASASSSGSLACAPRAGSAAAADSRPMAPGRASANGSCLPSASTGVWSEQIAARPFGDRGAQRVAVARRAQRRVEAGVAVEVADVHLRKMQVMDRHVATDRHAPSVLPRGPGRRRRPMTGAKDAGGRRCAEASCRAVAMATVSADDRDAGQTEP